MAQAVGASGDQLCTAEPAVYALKVAAEHDEWPEAGQREKLWTAPAEAAELVQEPELAAILRVFAPPA